MHWDYVPFLGTGKKNRKKPQTKHKILTSSIQRKMEQVLAGTCISWPFFVIIITKNNIPVDLGYKNPAEFGVFL